MAYTDIRSSGPGANKSLGFASGTVSTTAQTMQQILGAKIPQGASGFIASIEGASIRYRDDGGAPTATVGINLFSSGGVLWSYDKFDSINNLMLVAVSGSATLNVSFY